MNLTINENPKQEFVLKILPHNFENALNSEDETVSSAYKKWREESFQGWFTEGELENAWKALMPAYNPLEVFPEACHLLKRNLGYLKRLHKEKYLEVLGLFVKIYSRNHDDFTKWFLEEKIKVFEGADLKELEKKILKHKSLLYPVKNMKNKITDEMIEKAKGFPFENLLEFNRRGFTKCFAHEERTPSLHLQRRKNKIHCFGCQKSWDTISYVMDSKGVDFKQAILSLN